MGNIFDTPTQKNTIDETPVCLNPETFPSSTKNAKTNAQAFKNLSDKILSLMAFTIGKEKIFKLTYFPASILYLV